MTETNIEKFDRLQTEHLRRIVEWFMLKCPHSKPHPETVEMFTQGLLAAIEVSNRRPVEYAGEPWLQQTAEYHSEHADAHANNAWRHLGLGDGNPWLSDDGTPEIAHAVVRGMMCLYQHGKEQKK